MGHFGSIRRFPGGSSAVRGGWAAKSAPIRAGNAKFEISRNFAQFRADFGRGFGAVLGLSRRFGGGSGRNWGAKRGNLGQNQKFRQKFEIFGGNLKFHPKFQISPDLGKFGAVLNFLAILGIPGEGLGRFEGIWGGFLGGKTGILGQNGEFGGEMGILGAKR